MKPKHDRARVALETAVGRLQDDALGALEAAGLVEIRKLTLSVGEQHRVHQDALDAAHAAERALVAAVVDAVRPVLDVLCAKMRSVEGRGVIIIDCTPPLETDEMIEARDPATVTITPGELLKPSSVSWFENSQRLINIGPGSSSVRTRPRRINALALLPSGAFATIDNDARLLTPIAPHDLLRRFKIGDVLDGISRKLAQQLYGKKTQRAQELQTRAAQLDAVTTLVRGIK